MIFQWLTTALIGLLPSVEFPSGILNALGQAAHYAGVLNNYIPLDTFVNCALVIISFSLVAAILGAVLQLL